MKQMLMIGVVGFNLGLAGGTGIYLFWMGANQPHAALAAAADSLAADSLAADSLAADSAAHGEHAPPPLTSVDTLAPDTAAHAAAVAPQVEGEPASPDSAAQLPGEDQKRLAKLFSSMQPRDAARVLVEMSDDEIRSILDLLSNRQASAILGNLPPQRAAAISRTIIRGERSAR